MSLMVSNSILEMHAKNVASVFIPGRGYSDDSIKEFFSWFDKVIKYSAMEHKEEAINYVLTPLAHQNAEMAQTIAAGYGVQFKRIDGFENDDVKDVVHSVYKALPESKVHETFDSLVYLVNNAEYSSIDLPLSADYTLPVEDILLGELHGSLASHVRQHNSDPEGNPGKHTFHYL